MDAAVELFAPDRVLLAPGAPALEGTAAIRGWFTSAPGRHLLTVYAQQPDGRVRMIRDTFNGLPG